MPKGTSITCSTGVAPQEDAVELCPERKPEDVHQALHLRKPPRNPEMGENLETSTRPSISAKQLNPVLGETVKTSTAKTTTRNWNVEGNVLLGALTEVRYSAIPSPLSPTAAQKHNPSETLPPTGPPSAAPGHRETARARLHGAQQKPLLRPSRLGQAGRPLPTQLRHITVLAQHGEELRAAGLRRLLAPGRSVRLALLRPSPGGIPRGAPCEWCSTMARTICSVSCSCR